MSESLAETIWKLKEEELKILMDSGKFVSTDRRVHFYAPSFTHYRTAHFCSSPNEFPTISVTGKVCALKCKHCNGKVLETMHAADSPENLFSLCNSLKREGAVGCLVSGGCLADGSVPLGKFIPAIERVKHELGLTVFVHTGLLDFATASRLKAAGVDAVLIDVLGSDSTIKQVCNLKKTVADYEASLDALDRAGLNFVPHVIVGLDGGKLGGEFSALKMASRFKPSAIVIISFMPLHGTAMAETEPSSPFDVARVIAVARVMFPETPLVLGCMRPKGKHRLKTDVLALKAGVDAVAFPSEDAINFAESQGRETVFSPFCCAQIYRDLNVCRK